MQNPVALIYSLVHEAKLPPCPRIPHMTMHNGVRLFQNTILLLVFVLPVEHLGKLISCSVEAASNLRSPPCHRIFGKLDPNNRD